MVVVVVVVVVTVSKLPCVVSFFSLFAINITLD